MKLHQKFLEFNGTNILFESVEGTYWVAIKPICEALNVDYIRQFKNVQEDEILGQLLSKQTMVAADSRMRKMVCLPEKYVYGWIFSLRSESPEFIEYKRTCYELLFNHFHGTITYRMELLLQRREIDTKIYELKQSLRTQVDTYKDLKNLEYQRKQISGQLNNFDKDLIRQPNLFDQN